jgi:formylglycine-generating enzyme required for sulfatase activity
MSYVFISHSSQDRDYAHAFADRLMKEGYDVWLNDDSDNSDARWQITSSALRECAIFFVLMSPASEASHRVGQEINLARQSKKLTVPFLLSGENWAIFEAVRYVDISDGRLPWPGFFDQLARFAQRNVGRGKDVTIHPAKSARSTGELVSVGAESLLAIIENPDSEAVERAEAGIKLARIGDPRPGVGVRPNGLPDISWVDIPAGDFLFGSYMGDLTANMNEMPQAVYAMPDYAVSRYPITYAQYAAFVNGNGYANSRYWTQAGLRWRGNRRQPDVSWNDPKWHISNHPVIGVTWYEAVAFTRWLTERLGYEVWLPSEMEWEKAARGPDGRRFPWGNQFFGNHANCVQALQPDPFRRQTEVVGLGRTSAVGIFPEGASPYGVLDMCGNVWEWCVSAWRDSYDDPDNTAYEGRMPRVVRGGSWNEREGNTRVAARQGVAPETADTALGFRICAGPEG